MIEDRYTLSSIENFKKMFRCEITQIGYPNRFTYGLSMSDRDSEYYSRIDNEVEVKMNAYEFQRLTTTVSKSEHYRQEYEFLNHQMIRKNIAEAEESVKREKNPAAQKAYEKYLLLLNMTADGK